LGTRAIGSAGLAYQVTWLLSQTIIIIIIIIIIIVIIIIIITIIIIIIIVIIILCHILFQPCLLQRNFSTPFYSLS
jgi:hypothetical protein